MKPFLLRLSTPPLALSLALVSITSFSTPQALPQPSRLQKWQASLIQKLPVRWKASKTFRAARGAPGNREGGASRGNYRRSQRGIPGNRQGGASRGNNGPSENLVALRPDSNIELTLAAYPTFFVYVPPNNAEAAEFVLLDENDQDVYRTIATPNTPGVISLSLPSLALPPLKTGKEYHWYFSLIYDSKDRSKDTVVEGWVQRVEPSPNLLHKLEKTAPRERVALYTESGIWYDALTTLAELRRAHPHDPALIAAWAKLLESVGLNKTVKQPLIGYLPQ